MEDPDRLISAITAILESKQAHPLLDQMVNPDVRDDMPIADFTAASSSRGFGPPRSTTQAEVPQERFQYFFFLWFGRSRSKARSLHEKKL